MPADLDRSTKLILGVAALLLIAAWIFLRPDDALPAQVAALEQRLSAVEHELALANQRPTAAADAAHAAATIPPTTTDPPPASPSTTEIAEKIGNLSSTLAGLEQTTLKLDQRVIRSVQLVALESQIHKLVDAQQDAIADLRRIALQYQVRLDDDFFSKIDVPTTLAQQPGFFEARSRFIRQRGLLEATEESFVAELFPPKVEQ